MNKKDILKLAGVKNEKELYSKYKTHEDFLAEHGKTIKKMEMQKAFNGINYTPGQYSNIPSQLGYTNLLGNQVNLQGQAMNKPSVQQSTSGMPNSAFGVGGNKNGLLDKIGGSMGIAQSAGKLVEGIQALGQEKRKKEEAYQWRDVSGLQLQAMNSQEELPERRYVRPEDMKVDELYNPYGEGTNVLQGKNGLSLMNRVGGNQGEIQNTYAPSTLYNNLGYEPLQDSKKQYYLGGKMSQANFGTGLSNFATSGGTDFAGRLITGIGGENAGGNIGGTIGETAGSLIGGPIGGLVGKVGGQIIGGLLDRNPARIKKAQEATNRNIGMMAFGNMPKNSYMENGGWMNPGYNPQLITKFGNVDVTDIHNIATEGMDTLRTGGNIRQNLFTQQSMAMGGDLQVYNGEAESISQNPYLPDGGETVMFRGPSHENGGMPISYGKNPVEVEGGEPAVKLRDGGGQDNLVVFGNLPITPQYASILGDKDAKGKKFKNYIADLSKKEASYTDTINKSTKKAADLNVNNSFDKLSLSSYQANLLGGNMQYKNIADKKNNAAALQDAINKTAEENNIEADALALGKIKKAKKGVSIPKAETGVPLKPTTGNPYNPWIYGDNTPNTVFLPDYYEYGPESEMPISTPQYTSTSNVPQFRTSKKSSPLNTRFTKESWANDAEERPLPTLGRNTNIDPRMMQEMGIQPMNEPSKFNTSSATNKEEQIDPSTTKKPFDWMNIANQMIPYLRPSDTEGLNPQQLMGEMYALSQNQLEPVQAQTFQPQLSSPYDISLNDQIASVDNQARAAIKAAGNNPAAQAQIMAQATDAKNKILGEQFRMNQTQKAQTYGKNIDLMNESKLRNLGILGQQYERQAQAKSNTKALTQAALSSISDKYLKNKLENKQLQTMENLYNYRYDDKGRLINMNQLFQPVIPTVGANTVPEEKKKEKRNGAIVKAIKNL